MRSLEIRVARLLLLWISVNLLLVCEGQSVIYTLVAIFADDITKLTNVFWGLQVEKSEENRRKHNNLEFTHTMNPRVLFQQESSRQEII